MSTVQDTEVDDVKDVDFKPNVDLKTLQLPLVMLGRVNALRNLQLLSIKEETEYYREVHLLDAKINAILCSSQPVLQPVFQSVIQPDLQPIFQHIFLEFIHQVPLEESRAKIAILIVWTSHREMHRASLAENAVCSQKYGWII